MRPLLLLHGFTGAPSTWDAVLEHLPHEDVLRPALGGHGGPHTSWSEEVDRLIACVEDAGLEDVHLVGYSMGGRLGYGMLGRRNPRITRATLIGAHPGLEVERDRTQRRDADRAWIDLLAEGLPAFVEAWSALPMWASQQSVAPAARGQRWATRLGHDPAGLTHALAAYGLAEMPPVNPERVDVPVTLVAGEHDPKHRDIAARFAPRLESARLFVVPGAGHDVTLEAPAALAAVIREAEETAS